MDNLWLEVVDGQPVNHPQYEEHLLLAFGCIPENFVPFERVIPPQDLDIYEVIDHHEYQYLNGVWTDVYVRRPMTDEERIEKDKLLFPAATTAADDDPV